MLMSEQWAQALSEIKQQIGAQNFETWIAPVRFLSRNKNEVLLEVPNKFFRDWLTEHYVAKLEAALSSFARSSVRVTFQVDEKASKPGQSERPAKKDERERDKPQRANNLVAKYTFENFVIGASNQFAHAACVAVANQPGDNYNPLFIYGGVGLGKTHLVNAIGHHAAAQRPGLKVVYLSSESFMNELIASLRRDKMDEFKRKFRNVDILILDDVQFIAGKERTQEEFFHTFNSLYESHKQIVITSDKSTRRRQSQDNQNGQPKKMSASETSRNAPTIWLLSIHLKTSSLEQATSSPTPPALPSPISQAITTTRFSFTVVLA